MYPYYKDTALKRHLFVLKLETSTEVMTSEDGGFTTHYNSTVRSISKLKKRSHTKKEIKIVQQAIFPCRNRLI